MLTDRQRQQQQQLDLEVVVVDIQLSNESSGRDNLAPKLSIERQQQDSQLFVDIKLLSKDNNNDECDTTTSNSTSASTDKTTSNRVRSRCNMLKNIFLLSGMWGMGLGASFVQIPSAQNVLTENNYDSISTVPLGLIVLLSAPMAVIIPKLMARYGEKTVFIFAACLGCVGALLQMVGVLLSHNSGNVLEITFLMVGAAVQSFTYASTNNIRFAVAYFSPRKFLPKATAFVILGGAAGALLGPFLSNKTRYIFEGADNAGNFLQIAMMYFVYGVLALLVDFAPPAPSTVKNTKQQVENNNNDDDYSNGLVPIEEGLATESWTPSSPSKIVERSIREILLKTDLALLILCQSLSYNIMSLYMGDIALPMKSYGYDADQRTIAIFAHMLGMFLPSLFSGSIMGILGCWPTTCIGFVILLLGGGLFYVSTSLLMFIVGIIVVGVGWNLSFVGPSAALSEVYTNNLEKSKVQGFNDGIMLFTIGVLQLSAGSLYEATGSNWNIFNAILMGFSILCVLITFVKAVKTTTSFPWKSVQ